MLSKVKIKYVQSLQLKKQRQMYQKFVVEGDKMAQELLIQQRISPEFIFATDVWCSQHEKMLRPFADRLQMITEAELKQISSLKTPNQVLIVANMPNVSPDYGALAQSFSLYLDGIQDPGNLGTILRIADWFSIPAVFCADTCVDVFNPKVVQASMGALWRVQTLEIAFDTLQKNIPNIPVLGAVLDGRDLYDLAAPKKGLIVIGNEGKGISADILKSVTLPLTIHGGGGAESLNAAVATGIICATLTK
jgi:RNA methyltransferase, TrmH family